MRRRGIIEQWAVAERPMVEREVHYPVCDGEKMAENDMQHRAICYASGALRAHFHDRPDMHVRGDMPIYYRNGDLSENIVPDVFVVSGEVEVPLTSYKIWEVGVVPQFVLEVASESTRLRGHDEKKTEYEKLGVREYWRFDPTGVLFRPPEYGETVLGQRLGPGGRYEPLEPRLDGAVRSAVLGLEVCEVRGRLRFRNYRKGEYLRSHIEAVRAQRQAERSAEEERRRRLKERRLRIEAEQIAEEECRRWLRERRLRNEAEQGRHAAERRIAALEAMLRDSGRLPGSGPAK